MAYQIQYDPALKKKYPKTAKQRATKQQIFTAATLLVMILLLATNPTTKAAIRYFLIPGDPGITSAAFDGLLQDIKDGENWGDAVTAFCEEIIENAS